jgi:hypothetical protein
MGGRGRRWRGWGKGGEMTQILYAHMNKIKIKKKEPWCQATLGFSIGISSL